MAAGGGSAAGGGGGGDTYHFAVTINGANRATPELAKELYYEFAKLTQETREARGMRS